MQVLVQEIATRNPSASIGISAIMPRPCDNHRTSETVRRCNSALGNLAFRFRNQRRPTRVSFIATYRSFMDRTTGVIRPDMFGMGGLHPSTAGKKALTIKFDQFCNHQEIPVPQHAQPERQPTRPEAELDPRPRLQPRERRHQRHEEYRRRSERGHHSVSGDHHQSRQREDTCKADKRDRLTVTIAHHHNRR